MGVLVGATANSTSLEVGTAAAASETTSAGEILSALRLSWLVQDFLEVIVLDQKLESGRQIRSETKLLTLLFIFNLLQFFDHRFAIFQSNITHLLKASFDPLFELLVSRGAVPHRDSVLLAHFGGKNETQYLRFLNAIASKL